MYKNKYKNYDDIFHISLNLGFFKVNDKEYIDSFPKEHCLRTLSDRLELYRQKGLVSGKNYIEFSAILRNEN